MAEKAKPKLLVTYHRIYHMNIQDNHINLEAEMRRRDEAILDEIRAAGYDDSKWTGSGGVLIFKDPLPSVVGLIGITIIVAGMTGNSLCQ